jgi:uncharacterized protein (TIRG00374 family)
MNKGNLGRSIILLALAAFFVFRYVQPPSQGTMHLILAIVFGGLGLLGLVKVLSRRWLNVALNVGISLFFLDFVFSEIDLGEVGAALAQANYLMLIPSTIFVLLHIYFRTVRWQWLLKPLGDVPFWPAFRGLVIGITGNALLPARAGEFIRAYVLGRRTGLSKSGVFATLVIERIFDGLTVLLVLLAVIIWGVQDEILRTVGILGGIFYVGAIIALIIFMAKRQWIDSVVNRFVPEKWAEPIVGLLDGFSSGLTVLKNPGQLAMVTLYNILTWVMIPISFWFALQAFDFGVPVPWQAAVLMLPMMALGLTIPGAPGGVGAVQAAVKVTLDVTFAGQEVTPNFDETVAAASIVIHVSQFIPEIIPGIISFFYEGLTPSDISAGSTIADSEQVDAGATS